MKSAVIVTRGVLLTRAFLGCSEPLTTRETGPVIGTVGGAAAGGILGSTMGHPGAGAAVGGALGLGTGALIGDRLQAVEKSKPK
jgi:outer membrane lipoprotein SlyB